MSSFAKKISLVICNIFIFFRIKKGHYFYKKGKILKEMHRFADSKAAFENAYLLEPFADFRLGSYIAASQRICDWTDLKFLIEILNKKNQLNYKLVHPFDYLSIESDMSSQMKISNKYIDEVLPRHQNLIIKKKNKIKIGYFSSDFRNHALSFLIAGLIESHSREKFEIIGFSYGQAEVNDQMRTRLEAAFDHFIDISEINDIAVCQLASKLEIDIGVDLNGFVENSRTSLFQIGVSPIQINYLGFPGTLNHNYDYIIADAIIVPEYLQENYFEKIIYMPHCFQTNDTSRSVASNKKINRKNYNLSENSFIFCCLNSSYKITEDVFTVWLSILKKVHDSQLLLVADDQAIEINLINQVIKKNIDISRVVFCKKIHFEEYRQQYNLVDLFLDTFPFNGGVTLSDAIWCGVPVLTLSGQSFASRMGASLLNALQLSELVTNNLTDYEDMAIEIASNKDTYRKIKSKLNFSIESSNLFNPKFFAYHLEKAFSTVYEMHLKGISPNNIYLD
jgi:protein O-GlcNAc transferase